MFKYVAALILIVFVIMPLHADEKIAAAPTFETHIRPLLKAHCCECHGEGEKLKGGLDVRLARLLASGGKSGSAVVPGKAKDSLLLDRVKSEEMPPGKRKLTRDEITLLERWIAGGAKTERPEPASLAVGFQITAAEQAFWAFQPIRKPDVPNIKGQSAIDAFLLARLEEKALSFAPEAGARTLLRRVYFDLIGLPPTPAEVDEFVKAWDAPGAK